jgi:hypothetical protein
MPRFEEGTGRLLPDTPTLSRQDFMDRFPPAILGAVMAQQVKDTETGASVRAALLRYMVVSDVDVTDPRTIAGAEGMVDLAIALSAWPAEDRQSALDTILAPVA